MAGNLLESGTWAIILATGLAGLVVGYLARHYLGSRRVRDAESRARRIEEETETRQKELLLEAQEAALRIRREAEEENERRRAATQRRESRLQRRRESLDRKIESLDKRRSRLDKRQTRLKQMTHEVEELRAQQIEALERLSSLTTEEAKELLLQRVEEESRQDMARVLREVEHELKEDADRVAQKIISVAVQRAASEHVAESTVATVPLPSDDMKGRIIGKQGRNIRAMEAALGVDLIVDDTPEAVTISCFDPVRRETARLALTKLILDGRIHPARIEELVAKTKEEMHATLMEEGERALYELGLPRLPDEMVELLGRLKYRTSYGQNQLSHALETARIAATLAAELGANVEWVKEGALLHDIGKAISHETEGPHALIGAEIARRHRRPEAVVNSIESHHHEVDQRFVESVIVESADAISGARPGARRESLEQYLKRLRALEDVATSFDGVKTAYAIQAGREVRIIVKPEEIDDLAAIHLSKDVARKIEESLEYPGQVKVMVIRETRAVDHAK